MNLREKISFNILNFAILWNFSDFYQGDFLVSFLGLPFVLLGRVFYKASPDLFYFWLFFLSLTVFVVNVIAIHMIPAEKVHKLVLPKVYGFMLSLAFVNAKLLNLFLVWVIYNLVYKLTFRYFINRLAIIEQIKETLYLNLFWEKLFVLFGISISAGLVTNFFYNFLKIFSIIF